GRRGRELRAAAAEIGPGTLAPAREPAGLGHLPGGRTRPRRRVELPHVRGRVPRDLAAGSDLPWLELGVAVAARPDLVEPGRGERARPGRQWRGPRGRRS